MTPDDHAGADDHRGDDRPLEQGKIRMPESKQREGVRTQQERAGDHGEPAREEHEEKHRLGHQEHGHHTGTRPDEVDEGGGQYVGTRIGDYGHPRARPRKRLVGHARQRKKGRRRDEAEDEYQSDASWVGVRFIGPMQHEKRARQRGERKQQACRPQHRSHVVK